MAVPKKTDAKKKEEEKPELDAEGNPIVKKADDAAGADDEPDDDVDVDEDDEDLADPEKVKAKLKSLRDENVKRRLKNKELASNFSKVSETLNKLKSALVGEDDDADPEEKIKGLQRLAEDQASQLAIKDLVISHGITGEQSEYFEFLIGKAVGDLDEGEELSEESLNEIVAKAKGAGGVKKTSTGAGGAGNGKLPPPPGKKGEISAASFSKMTMVEKSQLYSSDPATYRRVFDEAKEKNLL